MISLKDIIKGPEMFEQTFGPVWGARLWRIFFVIVVLGIISVSASSILRFSKTVIGDAKLTAQQHKQTSAPYQKLRIREINSSQRGIIKSHVIRGATISIIPLMTGEPERFANEIATALQDAGAIVSVSTGNMILNGQAGLLVMFNHSDATAMSVFSGLKSAGLNPSDLANLNDEVVYIKVGPAD